MSAIKHCFDCFNLRINLSIKGKNFSTARFSTKGSYVWCKEGVLKKGKRIPFRNDCYQNKMFLIANECEKYDDKEE